MSKVVCAWRGTGEVDDGIKHLDESKVQLLFMKFPIGSGTFKRNKFFYVQYIGPRCGVVKRGQSINDIQEFAEKSLHGVTGFTTTDKGSLSLEELIKTMRNVFVTDSGVVSVEQIQQEYRSRIHEEQKKMVHDTPFSPKRQVRSRRSSEVPKPPPPPSPPHRGSSSDDENGLQTSADNTTEVLKGIRMDNGPVNWATFLADPTSLRVMRSGNGGIFELVRNLPEDMWLFGLFRISFFTGVERESRIIFFQWIGSKLKAVRTAGSSAIYPALSRKLAPFAYEIYLVGENDLKPQAIINKSRSAFNDIKKKDATEHTPKPSLGTSLLFTEDNYKRSLMDEQNRRKSQQPEFVVKKKSRRSRSSKPLGGRALEESISCVNVAASQPITSFDIEETVALVQQDEGGLVWALFEAK